MTGGGSLQGFRRIPPGEAALTQPAFAKDMDDTRRRILEWHLDLNLDFLDKNKLDNDVPTEGAPQL